MVVSVLIDDAMAAIVAGLDFRHMRIGFKTSQTNVDWPTLKATWELGDSLPVFDSALDLRPFRGARARWRRQP